MPIDGGKYSLLRTLKYRVNFVKRKYFNGVLQLKSSCILLEEQQWYYLTHSWEDKGVHTFPKGICPKVNVIAQLEYELAYYDSAVHSRERSRISKFLIRLMPIKFYQDFTKLFDERPLTIRTACQLARGYLCLFVKVYSYLHF